MKRSTPRNPIARLLPRGLVKHPLLAFAVCGVPILAAQLPAFLTDPRDLVFGGFLAGCLMCAIIFGRR